MLIQYIRNAYPIYIYSARSKKGTDRIINTYINLDSKGDKRKTK